MTRHITEVSFQDFTPKEYLNTYFTSMMEDEVKLMRWMATKGRLHLLSLLSAHDSRSERSMLDVGCGPTVHHLFPFAELVESFVVTDLLVDNIEEIHLWMNNEPAAHDWLPFAALCCDAMDIATTRAPDILCETVRRKLTIGSPVDLRTQRILGSVKDWDIVSMFFVACSATEDRRVFAEMVQSVAELTHRRGAFVGAFLGACDAYQVGSRWFPSPNLDERTLRNAFSSAGLAVVALDRLETPALRPDGFDHVFAVVAHRA